MAISKPLLSCVLGLLLAACAGRHEGAQSPTVTLTDIRPLEFGLLEQRYLIKLRIQNPNAFDLPINGLSYQLEINGQPFARGVSKRLLTVPSYGSELIEVDAFSSLAELFQQLSQLRKESAAEIRYRLVGKLSTNDRLSPLSFDQRSELVLPMVRIAGRPEVHFLTCGQGDARQYPEVKLFSVQLGLQLCFMEVTTGEHRMARPHQAAGRLLHQSAVMLSLRRVVLPGPPRGPPLALPRPLARHLLALMALFRTPSRILGSSFL